MKLTISPSEDQATQVHPYYAVSVEYPCDDTATAKQLVEMFYQAMCGMGYEPNTAIKTIQDFTL